MKAWLIRNEQSYENWCTVVFAETRGKAHALAMHSDCCEGAEWKDVRVTRLPVMDAMCKDRTEMDWYDPDDRIALVKECNWECAEPEDDECLVCPANAWCGHYEDLIQEKEEIT